MAFEMAPKLEPRIMPESRRSQVDTGTCALGKSGSRGDGGQSHMEKLCQLSAQLHLVSHLHSGVQPAQRCARKVCDSMIFVTCRSEQNICSSVVYTKSRTLVRIGRLGIRALRSEASPMILGRQPADSKAQPRM